VAFDTLLSRAGFALPLLGNFTTARDGPSEFVGRRSPLPCAVVVVAYAPAVAVTANRKMTTDDNRTMEASRTDLAVHHRC
jgi:hypothetical protein